jgi:RimJ/RimL family protein N-acetyltransferase
MSTRLESAHLVLTPLQFTDANDLHQAVRESLADLKDQFIWAEDPFTIRNAQAMVQESIASQREGKLIAYGIRNKTGRFLGTLTFKETPDMLGRKVPMHQVEIWIRTPDKGQNHGAEALVLASESLLKNGESKRVFAYLSTTDTSTATIYQQAGFQNEATLKNACSSSSGAVSNIMIAAKTV